MVEERLVLDEFHEIMEQIHLGKNFLLSGGAGSGKTYTLVQVIKQVILDYPTEKVACMTYTNAAVKQIEERVNHSNLQVTTIHDFLWDTIKHFRTELKETLIELLNDITITSIKIRGLDKVPSDYFDELKNGIEYKEHVGLSKGIISHDELLILSNRIYQKYSKICDILKDRYKFIFVDEYQDTQPIVVEILLEFLKKSKKQNIIGFYGDAMQAIYDNGIGNLDNYKSEVNEVFKKQNRRNPKLIIDLANKLRSDGLQQSPSEDDEAPNMEKGKIKEGKIQFLYSVSNDTEFAQNYLEWDFTDTKKTKELNLTHNLIATKAGIRNLYDIYDNDPVIGLKNDILNKIRNNQKQGKEEIEILEEDSFELVVDKFQLKNRQKELKKDLLLGNQESKELFDQLKKIPFSEVRKIYLNKDSLIDDKKQDQYEESKKGSKRDTLIKHLFKIQTNIHLYQNKEYNQFLRRTERMVNSVKAKIKLKADIELFVHVGDKTIENVIEEAHSIGICVRDQKLEDFVQSNSYLYNRVKQLPYKEFQSLFMYLEGFTPFSTQHKTKGAEFDNVFVALDNGKWNDYNFEYLFTPVKSKQKLVDGKSKTKKKLESLPKILDRTQKIFYVCCTRAKENLAVYYVDPSESVIANAIEWFGKDNVVDLDKK